MTNSETKNFSQNVSSSYHLGGECSDEYKKDSLNVPKLRFEGYNEEWKKIKLGEHLNICRGASPRPIEKYITMQSNGINWIKIGDISPKENVIKTTKEKITEEGAKHSRYVRKGDLILSNSMSFGRPYILEIDGCIHDGWLLIQDLEKLFDKKYLCYLLDSDTVKHQYRKYAAGGVVINLNSELVRSVSVFIPKVQEQEKIASFLTLIDKKIEKQKELIELLKKYKRGLLSQIFSQKLRFKDKNGNNYPDWEEKTLNNIFDIVTDFVAAGSFADLRKNVQYNEKPDFAQLVRTVDLKNNFKNKDFVFISESAYKYLWRVNLNEDALILPNIGANIGEVYYIYSFKLPYKNNVLGPNAILLKSANNNLYYLYSRCLTDNFRKQLFLQVGASGQPKFNKTDLKKIKIQISINTDEQNKISEFLSKFDDRIQQEESRLNYLQMYKKGLLQQLFI